MVLSMVLAGVLSMVLSRVLSRVLSMVLSRIGFAGVRAGALWCRIERGLEGYSLCTLTGTLTGALRYSRRNSRGTLGVLSGYSQDASSGNPRMLPLTGTHWRTSASARRGPLWRRCGDRDIGVLQAAFNVNNLLGQVAGSQVRAVRSSQSAPWARPQCAPCGYSEYPHGRTQSASSSLCSPSAISPARVA